MYVGDIYNYDNVDIYMYVWMWDIYNYDKVEIYMRHCKFVCICTMGGHILQL